MSTASSIGLFGPGDGCTLFIDGVGDVSWRHCCDVHDIQYELGLDKFSADYQLTTCVYEAGGGLFAVLMFIGVALGGWIFWRQRKPNQ